MTLTEISIAIGTGAIGSLIAVWVVHEIKKRRKLKEGVHAKDGAYDLSDPKYLLGIRADKRFGYNPYYYRRDYIDDEVYRRIDTYESLIVIGAPLSGKSRAVYEALKKFQPAPVVIIPSIDDVQWEKYPAIEDISDVQRTIILFDDMHKYAVRESLAHYLRAYKNRGAIIIATCRSGAEYQRLCENLKHDKTLLGKPIEIRELSEQTAKKVAQEANRPAPKKSEGVIGSIFVPIQAIEERYQWLSFEERNLLQSIKALFDAGIYSKNEVFDEDHIRSVFIGIEKMEATDDQWHHLIKRLEDMGFIKTDVRKIQIEETYLQKVIPGQFDDPTSLAQMVNIFSNDYDILFRIAYHASNLAQFSIQSIAYSEMAINALNSCLRLRAKDEYPQDHGLSQLYLGLSLWKLSRVKNRKANCEKAIITLKEALLAYPPDKFPRDYAAVQTNLGIAYTTMATIGDTAANCRNAINACSEALKIRGKSTFPAQFSTTQTNLGHAYLLLAEVQDKAASCKKAIGCFKEALDVEIQGATELRLGTLQTNLGRAYLTLAEVEDKADNCQLAFIHFEKARAIYGFEKSNSNYRYDRFPLQYADIQNMQGNAYCALAEVEDTVANYWAAIAAFTEALIVRTVDVFPMQYASTQNNLGNVYSKLAEVDNKVANCRAAIAAFTEALRVRTLAALPMDYAMTQNNLGNAYRTLAEVEDKAANCRSAIAAHREALQVYAGAGSPVLYAGSALPIQYAGTQNNLGIAYRMLAEVEDKAANCRAAIAACTEALRVYTLAAFPMDYAMTQNNLGVAYWTLAEEENKKENCRRAMEAFEQALKVRTADKLPLQHASTMRNLANLNAFCEEKE